jgi:hypothetical protein
LILRIILLVCLVNLVAGVSLAAYISIADFTEDAPDVQTDLPGANVILTAEEVSIGVHVPVGLDPITPGVRSVILVNQPGDPEGPGLPSDFATITVGAVEILDLMPVQLIQLIFQSDGAAGFDVNVALLPPGTPSIVETGALQDVSALLDTAPALTVLLGSDVPAVIPEPVTWISAGGALLGLAMYRRSRRI